MTRKSKKGCQMEEETVVIAVKDFPGSATAAYPQVFHNLDVCKDAEQARVKVTLAHTPKGTTLFEAATKALGFGSCKGYGAKLEKFEHQIQKKIDSDKDVIQKQINRLEKPAMSSRAVKDTGLPLSIKFAIRDSGPNADTFRSDIKYLEVPSDYSDPATRTPLQGRAPRFPPTDKPLKIGHEVFSMMLGKDIIRDFSAVMAKDNSCMISFKVAYSYMGKQHEVAYATKVGANYTSRGAVAGTKDASDFFQGNPEKNTYFNQNQSAWTIRKSAAEQAAILGDAISYLICKEFFGDVLIALIARKYKVAGSPEGATAVFTSDNALKSLCSLLQVDYVAKNWSSSAREEGVACLFSANPAAELEAGKAKIIGDVIAWNNVLIDQVSAHIIEGNEFNGIGDITKSQIEFFQRFFIPYTQAINAYLPTVSTKDARSLKEFREDIIRYQVVPVLKDLRGDVVILVRGVYSPFKYVPTTVPPPAGFPELKTEFVTYLHKIRNDVNAVAVGRVQLGKRRMRGGAGEKEMEEYMRAIDENPTKVLKDTIERVLSRFDLYDVHGKVDMEDIYAYLFTIYDIDCKVSFNEVVIEELIDGFLHGDVQVMTFAEVRTMYNKLLESQEVIADLQEEVTPIARVAAVKATKRPSTVLKRMTAKQRLYNTTRKKNSAQKSQRQKNRTMRAKTQRTLRKVSSNDNSLVSTPPRMAVE